MKDTIFQMNFPYHEKGLMMVDPDVAEERGPTKLIADLCQLDVVFDETRRKRTALAEKLESLIANMTIVTDKDNARVVEVQMQVLNTYRALLSDSEAGISRRVNSKLKQLDQDSTSKHSAAVAELLSKVSMGQLLFGQPGKEMDSAQSEAALERAFSESGLAPVMETELKIDPNDVT
jgi:hypothetical protein